MKLELQSCKTNLISSSTRSVCVLRKVWKSWKLELIQIAKLFIYLSSLYLFVTCFLYSSRKVGPNLSSCKSVAEVSEVSKSFSISSLTFSYETSPLF